MTLDVVRPHQPQATTPPPAIIAVVVTRDRPALLDACLTALRAQSVPPDHILVLDNASGPETASVLARHDAIVVRSEENLGGAGGFRSGIEAAMARGAELIWLMDDDGRPRDRTCLATLRATADRTGADLTAPMVVDAERPERLAFPIRLRGRTRFDCSDIPAEVHGFAHLFNGALIRASLFRRIGLPDTRLFIRGDEVEFLYRARRAGAAIVLAATAEFCHPSSHAEIHPIMGGRFYAVLPSDPVKQFYQFRNRGWIFSRYGMWGWLAADVICYGWLFLLVRGRPREFRAWFGATLGGVRGDLNRRPPAASSARGRGGSDASVRPHAAPSR